VLNFFHPTYRSLAADEYERRDEGTIVLPDSGRVFQASDSLRRDLVNQLNHVTFHFDECWSDGAAGTSFDVRITLRWVYKGEFALLLRAAGFERWQVCGGFEGEPLLRDDQEMVWTAWAG
jgi:hypothetical protein